MMRIALSVLAVSAIAAPLIGAGLAEHPRQPQSTAPASVSISQAQAIDIAGENGVAAVENISLTGGDWRVEGATPTGRSVEISVSAASGGVRAPRRG